MEPRGCLLFCSPHSPLFLLPSVSSPINYSCAWSDFLLRVIAELPGVVHRDIKPENILVQSRDPLHIKLADFGLSKSDPDLKSFCGTRTYAATEIFTVKYTGNYTKACDIWSLGVVILQYVNGLPIKSNKRSPRQWCRDIVGFVRACESDSLLNILSSMLVMEAKDRLSARKCLEQALRLSQSGCSTPTQAFYPPGNDTFEPHRKPESFAIYEAVQIHVGNYNKQSQRHAACPAMSNEVYAQAREPKTRTMKRKTDLSCSSQPGILKRTCKEHN